MVFEPPAPHESGAVKQIAELLGLDPAHITSLSYDYDDSSEESSVKVSLAIPVKKKTRKKIAEILLRRPG